ncbi:MAG: hypothetical protein K8S98_02285 [Planctomycetes bacterium]|nr:hypothetical protein [Planctomycetota bacterium]
MKSNLRIALALAAFLSVAPLAHAAQAPAPKPAAPTLAELANRSDLWPARVALRKELRFQGTPPLRVGQEVGVQDFNGQSLVLDGGGFQFDLAVTETDFLERARALAASLTPEQLAVTWTTLAQQPDLWPLRVKLNNAIGLQDGSEIKSGQELALRGFFGNEISVYDRGTRIHFTVGPHDTDLFAAARERVKLPAKEREPFFVRAVEASLEPAGVAPTTEHPLADDDFLLIYKARKGCTRCAAFTPELKEFYARAKAQYPRFELVFLSSDGNEADAKAYLAEAKLPGRVIAFERILEAADTASLPCQLLPGIFVVDRTGKVLEQNHPNGGAPGAADILAKFEQRLKAAAKPATK